MTAIHSTRRILVVDNDAGVRKTIKEVLHVSGYQVYVAEGSGEALIKNARQLLVDSRCHLAILDLRLINDNDPEDWSGFALASDISKQYPWVSCMFLTGYGSFDLARRALAQNIAVDVARKDSSFNEIFRTVDQVFSKIRCRWDQELEPSNPEWDELLAPLKEQIPNQEIAQSEFVEVLGRLFPEADKLHLRKLSDYESAPSVTSGHSILLRVAAHQNGRWLEDVAVKIGSHDAIQREIVNYDHFVHNQIGDYRYTFRQSSASTWYLGGIVYALIGAEIDNTLTLQEYYRNTSDADYKSLDTVLNTLFSRLFRRWYAEPKTVHINISSEYTTALGLNDDRLARLKNWGDDPEIQFAGISTPLPNPLVWIQRYGRNSDIETSQHIVHGDLHSRNVFVGPNQDVWLIDFERTGPGHCLRDYIELETDIKFSLMSAAIEQPKLFYAFETALLGQTRDGLKKAGALVPPALVRNHPEAHRVFTVITHLRQLATDRIRYPDLRDYFWGLLFQTVFVATLSNVSDATREQVKLSAALICQRLGDGIHLREPWPPKSKIAVVKSKLVKKKMAPESQRVLSAKRKSNLMLQTTPLDIFCSYSHHDEKMRQELEKHLTLFQRQGIGIIWHDRKIDAGEPWRGQIDSHLKSADIILLLVSPDFLASDYCYDIEMKKALERHDAGEVRVIPIILRPCDWQKAPFSKLQALPKDGKPVTRFRSRDEAYSNIAEGMWRVIEQVRAQ